MATTYLRQNTVWVFLRGAFGWRVGGHHQTEKPSLAPRALPNTIPIRPLEPHRQLLDSATASMSPSAYTISDYLPPISCTHQTACSGTYACVADIPLGNSGCGKIDLHCATLGACDPGNRPVPVLTQISAPVFHSCTHTWMRQSVRRF